MKKSVRMAAGLLSAVMLSGFSHGLAPQGKDAKVLPVSQTAVQCVSVQPAFALTTVSFEAVPQGYLIPGGMPFGIKMFTDGVMIVGMSDILCDGHTVNPAKEAGLRPGDVITKINGEQVGTNEEVARLVSGCAGEELTLTVCRKEEAPRQVPLQPVSGDDGMGYKAGMWVRDSSAGIGTVTYLDPESGTFGGLGHAVCDIDTGDLMPLSSGEAVNVTITGITKGTGGHPGELRGTFSDGAPIGVLTRNDVTGITGRLCGTPAILSQGGEPLPAAERHQIRTGKASIRATVDGSGVQEYEIVIEKIDLSEDTPTRNMVVRITDQRLIGLTGGIVQGMSGSPIIQDGKLVGAVTHVLVNDPTRGYGIFIENMLDAAR